MKWNYGHEVLTLPASVLSTAGADAIQLRALLWIASDLSLTEKPLQLAQLCGCDKKTAVAAVRFWEKAGVIAVDGAQKTDAAAPAMAEARVAETVEAKPKKQILRRADELPNYSTTELAELLEKRNGLRLLVDEAQRILGKMFNASEINVLVGMLDYLAISEEGILLILAHCKKIGKTNLRSIEKYAISLADREITEPQALDEEFRTVEAMHSFEGEIRTMFGMKSRALTAKESKMLRAWVTFGYGVDVIRQAYEITVNATGAPSLAYANAIMERWNSEGLKTLDDVMRAIESERAEKSGEGAIGKSFDTDDLFEAALKRSFSWTESKN